MKYITLLLLAYTLSVNAQIQFIGSHPQNGAVNVALTDTVSVTFSSAIDTSKKFSDGDFLLSNLNPNSQIWYSSDLKTVYFKGNLNAATDYFLLFYNVAAADGSHLQDPILIEFTTGSAFSGVEVSGAVSVQGGIVPVKNSLVALMANPLDAGNPTILRAAIADVNGNYSILHVPDGIYYPVAAKDVNGDGMIDPGLGDLIGSTDSITVNGANIPNLNITIFSPPLVAFTVARSKADSVRLSDLPTDARLYFVQAEVDSIGHSDYWEFKYISNANNLGFSVNVDVFGTSIDTLNSNEFNWISGMRPLGDSVAVAAAPDSFVIKSELNGGRSYRIQTIPDTLQMQAYLALGDLSQAGFWDVVPDNSKFYWGLSYRQVHNDPNNWFIADELRFLADFRTGQPLQITAINDPGNSNVPNIFQLDQNYPNPFNPATEIRYQLPKSSDVTLFIYNTLGQKVRTLVNSHQSAGRYQVKWNGKDDAGRQVASGVYFYKVLAGSFSQVRKMILMR